jgi:hypothetical protein
VGAQACGIVAGVRIVAALVVTALFCAPLCARAEDNSAALEALFAEGKRLMSEGKYAEACPKLLASYRLDEKRAGTLLNLADCYEKNGQLASAWARFLEAKTLAARNNQVERVAFATEHATALEPKLSRLTISVAESVPGLQVKRDGVLVDAGALGVAVPVDGGAHTIEAAAPGKRTIRAELTIGASADVRTFRVPPLEDARAVEAPPPKAAQPATSTRTLIEVGLLGVGVIGVGVGTYFGVAALGKRSDSDPYCGQAGRGPNDCYAPGVALRSDAVRDGTFSTVFVGLGVAAIAGAAVLWLTSPSSPTQVRAAFDGRSLLLQGAL